MAFGARFLKRVIDERIKLPISAQWKEGSHFEVIAKDGEIVVEPAPACSSPSPELIAESETALAYGDVAVKCMRPVLENVPVILLKLHHANPTCVSSSPRPVPAFRARSPAS